MRPSLSTSSANIGGQFLAGSTAWTGTTLASACADFDGDGAFMHLLAKLAQYRESEERIGLCDEFQIHVISIDGFTVDGVKRLEDKGVTDVIVGFRVPYIMGEDTQPLDEKIKHLEMFAENVIAKV